MHFSRLSLVLRLPLAILLCSQLVYLRDSVPLGDYFASFAEEVIAFDNGEDRKSFGAGLPVVISKDSFTQHSDLVYAGLGDVRQGITLDLRATGPPAV